MSLIFRDERPDDVPTIRTLNRGAFGRDEEGALVDALRDAGSVRLSLIAEENAQVVGHLLLSALTIVSPKRSIDALALAPMAVAPDRQRQGVGSTLVRCALEAAARQGHSIVIVLGDPRFYERFGFSAALAEPLLSPYSGEYFMARELVPGALSGVAGEVRYPAPFASV